MLAISICLDNRHRALRGGIQLVSLFFFRCTTGIGEAGGSPPSHSLISDYFAGSRRATALAVYAMAVPFGTAIGSFVSGHSNVSFGWRWTFFIVGAPGLLVALLAWLTIKEPPRGYSDKGKAKLETPAFLDVFRFLLTRKSFVHMSVAAAAHSVMWYAGSNWNPSFFVRAHGMNTGVAGNYLASFALIGAIGTFAGGLLADLASVRYGDRRWYMWVPAIACLTMVPFQFFAYLSPQLSVVVPTFTVMVVLASMFFGPSFAMGQSLATVRMRAMSASVLLFIQNIIGLTAGPWLVGQISNHLGNNGTSLRYAMVIVGISNIWAAFHYYMGSRTYRQDSKHGAAQRRGRLKVTRRATSPQATADKSAPRACRFTPTIAAPPSKPPIQSSALGTYSSSNTRRDQDNRSCSRRRPRVPASRPSAVNSAATPCKPRRAAPSVRAPRFRTGARRESPGSQRAAR